MSTPSTRRRLNMAVVGAGLTLAASLALLVLPPITSGTLVELRDLLPFGLAQSIGPAAQRVGGVALVSLLAIVGVAPVVAARPARRVLLTAAAVVLSVFCLMTILYNGLLYLPGAAALAFAAQQQLRRPLTPEVS